MIGRTNINGTNDASGVGAVLSINAPTSSTVTVSQGSFSKVLRNPIEINAYISRYFYLVKPNKFGSWTITATDGTNEASTTILITSNKEYEVELSFALYFVRNGVAMVTLTPPSGTTLTRSGNQLVWDSNAVALLKVVADLTNFNKIVAVLGAGRSWRGGQVPGLGYSASNPSINKDNGVVTPYTKVTLLNSATGAISAGQYEVDISSKTGKQYVWFSASYSGYSEHAFIRIVDWYLI